MEVDPASLDPEERTNKFLALFSIALGILSLCAALVPMCGTAGSLFGIGLGMFGLRSENRNIARVGIGFSVLALILSITYAVMLALQK